MKKFFFLLIAMMLVSHLPAKDYQAKDFSSLLGMPGFEDDLLKMHFQLYQGYVKNCNLLLAELQKMGDEGKSSSYTYGALKRRVGWEFDGIRLHELYFGNLGGKGAPNQNSNIYKAILTQFRDFASWKKDFLAVAAMRGVGWAVLYQDPIEGRLLNTWINEHDTGHLAGGTLLLVMDVWEHAFMPQFGLDRAAYADVFFKNIDWDLVEERWKDARNRKVFASE